jgi:hypothetical protein
MTQQPLLRIRLEVLVNDINKVERAIDRAKQRGCELDAVISKITDGNRSVVKLIQQLARLNDQTAGAFRRNDELAELLDEDEGSSDLRDQIEAAESDFKELDRQVNVIRRDLRQIRKTTKEVNARFTGENSTLQKQCSQLRGDVESLLKRVRDAGDDKPRQRGFWTDYEKLLDERARPLFGEYVDFLGGLTMRDTGLDDRVCEMTDVLLGRFNAIIGDFVPIPSRKAALSSALDSVIKLGFPEWSIWGVPLVAHEVGLALKDSHEVKKLQEEFAGEATKEQLAELYADVFGAYTLGPAYGYAALLLRLHPHHDEPIRDTEAKDVDRARLILLALESAGDPGTGYQTEVARLKDTWTEAVVTKAAPGREAQAEADARGPVAEIDWIDNFVATAREYLKDRRSLRAFDERRWTEAQTTWQELKDGRAMFDDDVDLLAVLNHAWAARLQDASAVGELTQQVEAMWNGPKQRRRSQ